MHYFSYFCLKHKLWYSLEPPRHNLCFEQKYKKYQDFLSENFHFVVVKFSVYLNRYVFVMIDSPSVGKGPVQRVEVAESTRQKWINFLTKKNDYVVFLSTLLLLNTTFSVLANSVDPDQLASEASEEAN